MNAGDQGGNLWVESSPCEVDWHHPTSELLDSSFHLILDPAMMGNRICGQPADASNSRQGRSSSENAASYS